MEFLCVSTVTDYMPPRHLCTTPPNKVTSVLALVAPAQGHRQNNTEPRWIKPTNLLYAADTY